MKGIVFLGITLYGLILKNKKNFWLLCLGFYLIMILTTKGQADYISYENYYNLLNAGDVEISYMGMSIFWGKLCLLCGKLNLTYTGMALIVISISMILIHSRIKKIKCCENLFWAFYLIFPGLIQCIQLRFFLATSVVFWGLIPFLKKEPNSIIVFCVSVITAYFIHSSCLIFFFFFFFLFFVKIGISNLLFFVFVCFVVMFIGKEYFIKIIQNIIPLAKFERYFMSDISQTTISWFIKILIVWFISYIGARYFYLQISKKNIQDENKEFLLRCVNAISLLLITTFFLIYDSNFHRFLEIGYMLFYIIFAYYFSNYKIENKMRVFTISFIFILLCLTTYNYTPIETVIKPFFTYSGVNTIFK